MSSWLRHRPGGVGLRSECPGITGPWGRRRRGTRSPARCADRRWGPETPRAGAEVQGPAGARRARRCGASSARGRLRTSSLAPGPSPPSPCTRGGRFSLRDPCSASAPRAPPPGSPCSRPVPQAGAPHPALCPRPAGPRADPAGVGDAPCRAPGTGFARPVVRALAARESSSARKPPSPQPPLHALLFRGAPSLR